MSAPARPWRVIFVCTGNSARSQMAEAVLNREGQGRFVADSAGSAPAARVHPLAVAALEAQGIAWHGHAPQGLDSALGQPWDIVVTVCDNARESCPIFPGHPLTTHWGQSDPAHVDGSESDRRQAFDRALELIRRRIALLVALPVDQLEPDDLQRRLDEIGLVGEEAQA